MHTTFVYSIDWVEFVFSSRTVAEELLLPEREADNLSSADYEKAINFLPRAKQYAYRPVCVCSSLICQLDSLCSSTRKSQVGGLLLCSLAALLGIRYRRPKWTTLQRTGVIACLGFTGFALGKLNVVKAHARFLRSIENPRGFSDAMRNIESRTGLQNHLTRGLKFTTVLGDDNKKEISNEREISPPFPSQIIIGQQKKSPLSYLEVQS
jgi:hypothetical protein